MQTDTAVPENENPLIPTLLTRIENPGATLDTQGKEWLVVDTWTAEEAILLGLGLDPHGTEPDVYEAAPGGVRACCFPHITSVDGLIWRRLPDAWLFSDRNHVHVVDVACTSTVLINSIHDSIRKLENSYMHLLNRWERFSGKAGIIHHSDFLLWLQQNQVQIPWLTWAQKNHLLRDKRLLPDPINPVDVNNWKAAAHDIAVDYLERHRKDDLFPPQDDVCRYIAKILREKRIYSSHGHPLSANSIKRDFIQGDWWGKHRPAREE